MSSSLDPYAELASLFLTEGNDAPAASIPISLGAIGTAVAFETNTVASDRASSTSPIEIALVGHLPVMGGLWLTQYADQVARREGPTALVRLERGQVTLELLRCPGQRGTLERAISVDEALDALQLVATRWIICPQSEAAMEGPLAADALSLLTGGDDAATVAAYRIMKNLAERWHVAGWAVPPIGLVVLGAPSERVEEVAEKLDRTMKAFLDVDLAVVGQFQRMDAIESAGRRTFQGVELSVSEVCQRARSRAADRAGAPRSASTRPTSAKLAPKAVGREVPPPPAPFSFVEPAPESLPHAIPMTPFMPRAMGAEPESAALDRNETVDERVVDVPAPSTNPMAVAHELGDLTPLSIRCPHHAEVELARDRDGVLHLVVLDRHLAALRPVEAWARAHRDLLRAACPELAAHEHTPIADVVTFDAPSIVPLHGTGLRLHLLVETASGSVCVALNR